MRLRRNRLLLQTLSLFTDADLAGNESSRPAASAETAPAGSEAEDYELEEDYDAWYDIRIEDEPGGDESDEDEPDDGGLRSAQPTPTAELFVLYDELNRLYFEGILPPCDMKWSRRLTRAAGTIRCEKRLVTLSIPLLVDPFRDPGAVFEICGVRCASYESALREILKHEMIHMWLYVQKLPHGHTPAFRAKARAIGQPRTRHNIALPPPTSGWIYRCSVCASELHRRRRFSRPVACASCCKTHNRGKYDERFKLRGRRL